MRTFYLQFTRNGGVIKVSATIDHEQIELSVADNGVGINEKLVPYLFESYNKEIALGTALERGSGLGLVLCKEFVEKLEGRIWVVSEEGKGSDFRFTLPLNKVKA